jgi:hypothetical protein
VALAEQQIAQLRAEAECQVVQAQSAEAEAIQAVTRLEMQVEELAQQLVAVQQESDAACGTLDEAVLAEQRAQARLDEQRERLANLHRLVEAQATELSQARAELRAQAKISGEVDVLQRQMAGQSRSRHGGAMK